MKKGVVILLALLSIAGTGGLALADNATILKEIQSLKERIEELEQKLEEQESLAKRQVAKTEKNIEEKISESLEERFGTLEIHYRIAAAKTWPSVRTCNTSGTPAATAKTTASSPAWCAGSSTSEATGMAPAFVANCVVLD